MNKKYHYAPITLTREQFGLLMDKLQENYNKDYKSDIENAAPPKYDKQKSRFFGYTDSYPHETSLYHCMMRHEQVLMTLRHDAKRSKNSASKLANLSFNQRYLYTKYQDYEKKKLTEFKFDFPYSYIFFEFIGMKSYEEFMASLPEELTIIPEIDSWEKFYKLGLRSFENEVFRDEILIDFDNKKVKMISDTNDTYEDGLVEILPPFIKINMNRYDERIKEYAPITMYFKWKKTIEKLVGIVGTSNGAAHHTEQNIALTCVLIRQEYYETHKLDIERFLFLERSNIDITENLYHFLPNTINHENLKRFIGTHELYKLSTSKTIQMQRYVIEIRPDFYGELHTDRKADQFSLRLLNKADGLMMFVSEVTKGVESNKYAILTSVISISLDSLDIVEDTYLYQGSACGISKVSRTMMNFPLILAINPPKLGNSRRFRTQDMKDFMKEKEREKLNTAIIEKLHKIETTRSEIVSSNMQSLGINFSEK